MSSVPYALFVSDPTREHQFPEDFDDRFPVGTLGGNDAYFGRNVLAGLVDGIDDFIEERQVRWRGFRSVGPTLLGSAMWIDDEEVIDQIARLSAACIVVTKQGRSNYDRQKLAALHELNARTPGIPTAAFAELTQLAATVDGRPIVVGPYDRADEAVVPTVRTLGYRRLGDMVPIVHAKVALLGHLWWHDEGPLGIPDDVLGFTAQRLWIGSANFTGSSRRNLEFGYWTEQPELLAGARRFLVQLLRFSEAVDPDSDVLDPELAPVEYDDVAMAEAFAELRWEEGERE